MRVRTLYNYQNRSDVMTRTLYNYQNRSDVMTRRACTAWIINNLLSIRGEVVAKVAKIGVVYLLNQ